MKIVHHLHGVNNTGKSYTLTITSSCGMNVKLVLSLVFLLALKITRTVIYAYKNELNNGISSSSLFLCLQIDAKTSQHNMVDSRQNACTDYLKSSEISANYALAVEPGYITRGIYICGIDTFPVEFIHARCTIINGNF